MRHVDEQRPQQRQEDAGDRAREQRTRAAPFGPGGGTVDLDGLRARVRRARSPVRGAVSGHDDSPGGEGRRAKLNAPRPTAETRPLEPWRYTSAVLPASRSLALRVVALALAIAVGSSATGLPMCLNLLAQAATPCHIHRGHHGSTMHQRGAPIAALVPQRADQACHHDATGVGCAAGSACPTDGPAAPAWTKAPLGARSVSRTGVLAPAATLISYLAPPLAPPPQA